MRGIAPKGFKRHSTRANGKPRGHAKPVLRHRQGKITHRRRKPFSVAPVENTPLLEILTLAADWQLQWRRCEDWSTPIDRVKAKIQTVEEQLDAAWERRRQEIASRDADRFGTVQGHVHEPYLQLPVRIGDGMTPHGLPAWQP